MKLLPCLLLSVYPLCAATYCDEPKEVAAELRRSRELWDKSLSQEAMRAERRAILEALVRKFPDDIQANRRYQNDSGLSKAELLRQYTARKKDDALSTYFYALALSSTDLEQATKLFDSVLVQDPAMAWPHMALAYNYSYGPAPDRAKATLHVDAFFSKCPTSYDFYTNRMLATVASPAVMKRGAAALRERVDAETDPDLFGIFEHLWMLEFKSLPPEEHPGLRARVLRDVARIRKSSPQLSLPMLRLVRDGMKQANDAAGVEAAENDLLRAYPESRDAADLTMDRWRKAHPYVATKEHWAASYAVSAEWISRWPANAVARSEHFSTALRLKDLPAAEVKAAGDQFLSFLKGNDVIYGFKPFEHELAEEYVRRGVYLDEVPGLAERGLAIVNTRTAEQAMDRNVPPKMQKMMQAPARSAAIAAVDLLARVAKREQAPELENRLEPLQADGPAETSLLWQARSRVAELAGRNLDALAYMEKALDGAPEPVKAERRSEVRRLWTAAGGTEKAWAVRAGSGVQEAKSATAWIKPEKGISAWSLKDMSGKLWNNTDLAGKKVLINVWATWCGPCRAEHPHFQKLYERLKGRDDVVVISFNVDDQVGMVQSYLTDGKYTFPVLLADRLVRETLESVSIPRNWLIDQKGVHKLEQVGFLESPGWLERMVEAVDSLQ